MPVVPRSNVEKISWYRTRIAAWTANATAIGTTTTAVTDIDTKADAAQAALEAADLARAVSKAATITLKQAVDALDLAGAGLIKQVRAKAETTGNINVYALAQLPDPATPAPVGAPGTAYDLKAVLNPDGSLDLAWKANNPAGCIGVVWQLYRKVEATGEYDYIGGAGSRKFTDVTVPAAVPSVTYRIQGTRSTAVGSLAQFTVNFGVVGSTPTVTAAAKSGIGGTPGTIAA